MIGKVVGENEEGLTLVDVVRVATDLVAKVTDAGYPPTSLGVADNAVTITFASMAAADRASEILGLGERQWHGDTLGFTHAGLAMQATRIPQRVDRVLDRSIEGDHCGYAISGLDGEQEPCGRPVAGYRWYQNVGEHEDMLDTACEYHRNTGGDLIASLARAARSDVHVNARWTA